VPESRTIRGLSYAILLMWRSAAPAQVNVLTANYGNERTNANLQEQILSVDSVNPDSFGKLGSFPVDGAIYAQPLYVSGLTIGGATRNVVFVATTRNNVYAIDADAPESTTALWRVNLGPPVPSTFINLQSIGSEVGILSTPVIDLSRNAIYVVAETIENNTAVFRLHALDLSNGSEKPGGPAVIQASVIGDGDGREDGRVIFDPVQHLQRPGLLLANDTIYIAFGSHADDWPYHGWVMGYDSSSIQHQTAVFNATPHGGQGAIWQAGRGLAADSDGFIYVATGNGDYDGELNFSESFLKLSPGLALLDWFTPKDWSVLSDGDFDLGSLGPMLTPDGQLLGGDKAGNMYLVNKSDMGHLGYDGMETPQITQPIGYGGFFNIALWDSASGPIIYLVEQGDYTGSFRVLNGRVDSSPVSTTGVNADIPYQGMAISADGPGASSGILWMTRGDHLVRGPAAGILHAFDSLDLSHELWNSTMNGDRDQVGAFVKFTSPTVANGRVYVPTLSNQLVIYGLLPVDPTVTSSQPAEPARRGARRY